MTCNNSVSVEAALSFVTGDKNRAGVNISKRVDLRVKGNRVDFTFPE